MTAFTFINAIDIYMIKESVARSIFLIKYRMFFLEVLKIEKNSNSISSSWLRVILVENLKTLNKIYLKHLPCIFNQWPRNLQSNRIHDLYNQYPNFLSFLNTLM